MRAALQFMAYRIVELPDINPSAPVFNTVLGDKIRAALNELPDDWMMEYVDYLDADNFDKEVYE